MGNHRFRLSDMIPNSWFYKLKDMGRTRNQNNNINHPRNKKQPLKPSSSSSSSPSTSPPSISIPPQQFQSQTELSHQRKSYYFTRELTPPPPQPPITSHESSKIIETHLPDPPRKSSKQRLSTTRRRNRASSRQPPSPLRHVAATVSTGCSCRANIDSVWAKPDSTSEEYPISPLGSSSDLQSLFPEFGSDNDSDVPKFDVFDAISQLHLPPILTKKNIQKDRKNLNGSLSVKVVEKEKNRFCKEQRKSPVRSPGVRIRLNSPRIARIGAAHGRKSASSSRRSLSESFAVVKSSVDPQRDFRESMVEMILENNLKASKDLEDLLACYLQLNSDEYHEVIVEVFKQIWFDLAHVRFKN